MAYQRQSTPGYNTDISKLLAQARKWAQESKARTTPQSPVGSPAAPDNAAMMTAQGQIAEIYDVLDADGNPLFILGVTGMADGVGVE